MTECLIVAGCTMRAAWLLLQRGELEADAIVVRTCTTRGCMRHLTRARHVRGARSARLTVEDVRSIRREYATGASSYPALAERYGLSVVAVRFIVTRRRWKNVS